MSPLPGSDLYENPSTGNKANTLPKPSRDKLSSKDDQEAAGAALAIWRAKDRIWKKRLAQWRVNEFRRGGVKNVLLRKRGREDWYAWVPPSVQETPDALNTLNAAASQCRKFASLMFADPPAPDAQPSSGEEEDRDAAEFTTRALTDLQGPKHLNDAWLARRAFDKASTFGSGYVWYYIDEAAGGRAPLQVSAGVDPVTQRAAINEDELLDDPDTGQPWPHYVEAYLDENGNVTPDVDEARLVWLPEVRGQVLTGRNVRMIPHTAERVDDAEGVQIAMFVRLNELMRRYPDAMDDLDDEEKEELTQFRPNDWKWLVSDDQEAAISQPPEDIEERAVFVVVTYLVASPRNEDGLFLVTAGRNKVLARDKWVKETDFGLLHLPLPITEYAQFTEGEEPPPKGLMEILGPGNEVRAKVITDWLEHLSWLLSRRMFLPMHSNLRPQDFQTPAKTPLRILPGGEPKYEEVPPFPPDAMRFMDFVTGEMQVASSMTEVAQGLESPQVQSGRHAQAIISQVHAALSDVRQNIIDGYLRGSRIQVALIKAFYARERRISWVGEDGAYKERRWSGADLRGTTDVALKHGTLTMLSPVAKAQLAEHFAQLGLLDRTELREITSASMGPLVGMQDNPFLTRIRRQLARWQEGPPDGWAPQFEQVPVEGAQPDPVTGQPPVQPQQIMDPVLTGIFRPYPQDDLPHVALIRLRELSKLMSRSVFAVMPAEWQFGVVREFSRAQASATGASGVQPGQDPPAQRSPAQVARAQGAMALPETPLPSDTPASAPEAGII